MAVAHIQRSLYILILRQGEVGRHHIAVSRHLATTTLQLHRLDKQCYLGELHGTFIQIHTIEVVLHDELRHISAAEVGTIIVYLVDIHVVENRKSINQEVAATTGRVYELDVEDATLLRVAHLALRTISYEILYCPRLLIHHEMAVGIHLQVLLAQGVVHQELHHPLRGIDLAL